jgi:hypothetical protein
MRPAAATVRAIVTVRVLPMVIRSPAQSILTSPTVRQYRALSRATDLTYALLALTRSRSRTMAPHVRSTDCLARLPCICSDVLTSSPSRDIVCPATEVAVGESEKEPGSW